MPTWSNGNTDHLTGCRVPASHQAPVDAELGDVQRSITVISWASSIGTRRSISSGQSVRTLAGCEDVGAVRSARVDYLFVYQYQGLAEHS